MSAIRDRDLSGGSDTGSITQSVVKSPFALRTGREYLLADYPDAVEFPSGLMPLAIEQNITLINPYTTKQGVYVGRSGNLIIQVTKTATSTRFQLSVDAGVNWQQIQTPSTYNIDSFWKFALAPDGTTIFAWWFNQINNQTHTANIISYDNGGTFESGVHDGLVSAGVTYSGSTVLAAAFSVDSQTMYVATKYDGIYKSVRESGEFLTFTLLANFRILDESTFEKMFVVDDINPADPAYGNIVFSHNEGVVVFDSAGNVLADEITEDNDGPSIYKNGVFISKRYYSVDGGLSVRKHNQTVGTFAVNNADDMHDLLLTDNKLLVGYLIDEQVRDNGDFGATFNGEATTEVLPAIDGTANMSIRTTENNFAVLASVEKDPLKFYVPYISNTLGPRGESLNLVRI
ncbi:hypothetical protein Patl_0717 [Paraglaciecola sp. T6c]|uniref:hypothetical protein n=1 Tax=Pseudoalteromonas atlantica (strain T6c / ATCC BAA-1087) TaxID=3042615 RepID=UPI00005C6BC3|nr:hypothetical protein [Paraglaciecola sp. T6c]ABG39245.1 hypothetical protein Patl_0717 [Paraglaciecola sp. T6c]